jgi:hypothetical protein
MRKLIAAVVGFALLGAPMVASAHPIFVRPWYRPAPVVVAPSVVPVAPAPVVVGPAFYGPRFGYERPYFPHYYGRHFGRGWRR